MTDPGGFAYASFLTLEVVIDTNFVRITIRLSRAYRRSAVLQTPVAAPSRDPLPTEVHTGDFDLIPKITPPFPRGALGRRMNAISLGRSVS